MLKNDKPPFEYKCDKCKKEIFGGFNPSAFHFDHGGFKGELCSPCYTDYWKGINKLEKEYVKEFFHVDN